MPEYYSPGDLGTELAPLMKIVEALGADRGPDAENPIAGGGIARGEL
jgi:hypothetical protein